MPWDCPLCGERFKNQKELNRHLRTKHRNKVGLTIFEHHVGSKDKAKSSDFLSFFVFTLHFETKIFPLIKNLSSFSKSLLTPIL